MSCTHAVHVPHPLIKRQPAAHRHLSDGHGVGRNGTTAGRVAPGNDGLVQNRRAPQPGTAAKATTEFGSSAHPATLPGCGVVANGWTAREIRLVREAVRPEPGTARQAGLA
jgi:hypothetical protein